MNTRLKNFGFRRKSGILLAVSSLPSRYGIGDFGKSAYDFIDFLAETKQKCWQVLPLVPTSYGDSPYQSPASFAGNPYYISPETLYNEGLLKIEELEAAKCEYGKVDYGKLFSERFLLLRRAYTRFEPTASYRKFCRENASWLEDYSLFMALKVENAYRPFTEWRDEQKYYAQAKRKADEYRRERGFWNWVQFEFHREWIEVMKYAHKNGIKIIGDMPIYVAHDSADVWSHADEFLLDRDLKPTLVAGVPPDAFSDKGQLWGNPIYDWDKMREDGYSWWISRISSAMKIYDIVRIDHFRGFAGYFAVKNGEKTAENGQWHKGPGYDLFEKIKEAVPNAKIIAEDLGVITPDVRELLDKTEFPGMKVLQFAFGNDDNEYLPRLYKNDNCIVYTGSHDSECTKSWYKTLDKASKKRFRRECPREKGQSGADALIELAMSSRANLAVIPIQDYMGLENAEGRMNHPSTTAGNWQWRLPPRYATKKLIEKIKNLTIKTKRD
ncbi:MAG: 4-alpha-glucanotransferase [Clostridia bacterium]|nr:4-alpha-glucanotransferase [Clostridia bacterium]